MSFFEPQSTPTGTSESAPREMSPIGQTVPAASEPVVEVLPTMADLDRLASDLDRVDHTLAELDGPAGTTGS